jgi:adenylate cyclase class 2
MAYEVELKFPAPDLEGVVERLLKMGAELLGEEEQEDCYLQHPCRDFNRTDEALRVRRAGVAATLTYKGPKLDSRTKTRQEIELPVPGGAAGVPRILDLLEALGFEAAARVHKRRRRLLLPWQGRKVEVALDAVEGLGPYLELELPARGAELEEARTQLLALAAELSLGPSERRSYLELLTLPPSRDVP